MGPLVANFSVVIIFLTQRQLLSHRCESPNGHPGSVRQARHKRHTSCYLAGRQHTGGFPSSHSRQTFSHHPTLPANARARVECTPQSLPASKRRSWERRKSNESCILKTAGPGVTTRATPACVQTNTTAIGTTPRESIPFCANRMQNAPTSLLQLFTDRPTSQSIPM